LLHAAIFRRRHAVHFAIVFLRPRLMIIRHAADAAILLFLRDSVIRCRCYARNAPLIITRHCRCRLLRLMQIFHFAERHADGFFRPTAIAAAPLMALPPFSRRRWFRPPRHCFQVQISTFARYYALFSFADYFACRVFAILLYFIISLRCRR